MKRAARQFIGMVGISVIALTGCESVHTPIASNPITLPPTPSATVTLSPSPTATSLPSPTLTQTPQPTASDTPIPTLEDTATTIPFDPNVKQILIEYGIDGGDGGDETDVYYGRGMPSFVLYTDGQLILQTSDTLLQKTLSTNEVCTLLAKIKATGFFEIPAGDPNDWVETHKPIYQSVTATEDVGEGGLYEYIVVNDEPTKAVFVYYILRNYRIEPVRRAFDLITTYRPDGLQPYQPKQVLLWVEPIHVPHYYNDTPTPAVQTWPTNLPSLTTSLNAADGHEVFVIQGATVSQVLNLFDQLPGSAIFLDQGQAYTVIARPLLPNETADHFSEGAWSPVSVKLPFKCS